MAKQQLTIKDVLTKFDYTLNPILDKKVDKCEKCGKAFRMVSIEDDYYKICACQRIKTKK
jgi:hypothetical protein